MRWKIDMAYTKLGYHLPTEYDMVVGGIIGNFNYILERYPRDTILIKRIQSFATQCLQLGALIGSDKEYLDKFNEVIRKERA